MAPYAGLQRTNTSSFKSLRSLLFPVDPSRNLVIASGSAKLGLLYWNR